MVPPMAQLNVSMFRKAGSFLNMTFGDPGAQGAGKAGTQVANVIAQAPNVGTFVPEMWSPIFAAGFFSPCTLGGGTINEQGEEPAVQTRTAL